MEESLTRVLTPTSRVELLADIAAAKAEKRPYVIVFVGVNGVGKSTRFTPQPQTGQSEAGSPSTPALTPPTRPGCATTRVGPI